MWAYRRQDLGSICAGILIRKGNRWRKWNRKPQVYSPIGFTRSQKFVPSASQTLRFIFLFVSKSLNLWWARWDSNPGPKDYESREQRKPQNHATPESNCLNALSLHVAFSFAGHLWRSVPSASHRKGRNLPLERLPCRDLLQYFLSKHLPLKYEMRRQRAKGIEELVSDGLLECVRPYRGGVEGSIRVCGLYRLRG